MSVSVLSLLVDPVTVTAIQVSPSERCCSGAHTTPHEDLTSPSARGDGTVGVKGEANRTGDFKCLP